MTACMTLILEAKEKSYQMSHKGGLWTTDKAKGLAVCLQVFGGTHLWHSHSTGLCSSPIKASLFLEEKTSNKYWSRVYYLIYLTIIPEYFSKYNSELLVGVSSACQWWLRNDLVNEEYLKLHLYLLLSHPRNLRPWLSPTGYLLSD